VKGFLGIQLLLFGTFALSILNIAMWFLTLVWILGRFHFIEELFPGWVYFPGMIELLLGNFFLVYLNLFGVFKRKQYYLDRLAVLSPFYWVLMSVAMVKAALQVFSKPAFWEKTEHGLYVTDSHGAPLGFRALAEAERRFRASGGSV
jgi:hypothetical protein